MPKLIVIASQNPVKLEAVQRGFSTIFPEESFIYRQVSVPSGVAVQPFSDAETLKGAANRAQAARAAVPKADFWVGLEGGVAPSRENDADLMAFAWVVVCSSNQTGNARTGVFVLPGEITRLVKGGMELGLADDQVFGTRNSKQNGGAVGLLTGGALTRAAYYAQAVQLALIPFRNPRYYA